MGMGRTSTWGMLRVLCVLQLSLISVNAARPGKEAVVQDDAPLKKLATPLVPDEIETAESQEKPKVFWYNTATGESSWMDPTPAKHTDPDGNEFFVDPSNHTHTWWTAESPEEWSWEEVPVTEGEHANRTYFHNTVSNEVVWEAPVMLSWKKMSTERVFYFNQVTGESQHSRPLEMGFWSEEHNRTYWVDDQGDATWESKYWWTQVPVEGEEGKFYYVNEMTKESSWEVPSDLAWVLWHEEL